MSGEVVSIVEVSTSRDGMITMAMTSDDTAVVAKMHPDDARGVAAMLIEACDHLTAPLN